MNDEELKKVVAINDLTDNKTLAHLLKYDSSQGQFSREVTYDEEFIIVDGHKIHATAERDPANLPWGEWNADVILESTGFFASREGSSKHIAAGAKKVLISAPANDPDLTMCLGINDSEYDAANHHIVSNAS
ncbi:glyceraldehyde 3-phosphate dehydrogenase N-terminal domain-containing protein, partial [Akkermansiaceae bacterium]|nr:glyceraldehyde 3-phosphate dehydrogenase N-terminal domain-containing protein [Akkermansiaceae bacterium]